jgi:hypothetical protein
MRVFVLSLLLLSPTAVVAQRTKTSDSLRGRPDAARPEAHASRDGRFSWVAGATHVTVYKRKQHKKSHRVRLPAPTPEAVRKVLFARHGDYFAVVDEIKEDLGLHLRVKKGAKKAKATVVRSGLTLMDAGGRILWKKRLRDQHVVGRPGTSPLDVSTKGTLAILLQDKDPYQKARPLLIVYGPRGGTRLRLDYLDWRHVDEFTLSDDGKYLAVRGFGRITDYETWDTALGFYQLGKKKSWVQAIANVGSQRILREIDPNGRTCCIEDKGGLFAFSRNGDRAPLSPTESTRALGNKE